jgi:ankyrin repeat protein
MPPGHSGVAAPCYSFGMNVNAVNSMGLTALHGAANRGSDDIIRFLVDKGAKLDRADSDFGRSSRMGLPGADVAEVPAAATIFRVLKLDS